MKIIFFILHCIYNGITSAHVTQGYGFKYFWSHIMTLSPLLNDECYESSLIEDLVCLDIGDRSLQEELGQIVELVANNLGIKDDTNLILRSIFNFDRGWR